MKNGIKYLVAGLVATGLTVSSYASVTVNWATGANTFISDAGGVADDATQLALGDVMQIGTWASIPSSITAATLSGELSSFEVFASGTISQSGGVFSLSTANTAGATFTGKEMFMIAYNATSTGAATQWAIFSSTLSTWVMPADSATASMNIDPADLFASGGGTSATPLASGNVLWGTTALDGPGGFSLINTQAVPEPSTYVLVGTGLLGLLGLRRRRS